MKPVQPLALGKPAQYSPWLAGEYDVSPRLKGLGFDFGNADLDSKVFQIDSQFDHFRAEKLACRAEDTAKYQLAHRLSPRVETAATTKIVEILQSEWPQWFHFHEGQLACHLTGEVISPTLEQLALQVQEDFAIVSTDQVQDWISYLNVCLPSHWSPAERIGGSFFATHSVVPGMERVTAISRQMVDAMVHKGPFVRFVWGLQSDNRLNHHPEPPAEFEASKSLEEWIGQDYTKPIWVRAERQVIYGLPQVGAALFLIRVSMIPEAELIQDSVSTKRLVQAVASMSSQSRTYKGINPSWQVAEKRLLAAIGDQS